LSRLNEHTENFNSRVLKAEQERVKNFEPADGVEYDEKCDDVMWFIQKTMQDWDHDLAGQMIGWDKSIEGKKARELFRETKRNLTNLVELLLNKVGFVTHTF